MYAIVKTGGKQYKAAPGDYLNIEKIEGEAGDKVELTAITIVEQFRGQKQLVFKFKKRKNYKKLQGHRQNLTRVQITAVGGEQA